MSLALRASSMRVGRERAIKSIGFYIGFCTLFDRIQTLGRALDACYNPFGSWEVV
jgi:hypothetical protein